MRPAPVAVLAALAVLILAVAGQARPAQDEQAPPPAEQTPPPAPTAGPEPNPDLAAVQFRPSRALGKWWRGRLRDGVLLPEQGVNYFSWDPIRNGVPNREWRRWGTDTLVRTLLAVTGEFRADNPWAPRVGIGDLSRPQGGRFGREYGGLGHASHQNGLDADVWYPRVDGTERRPRRPDQVDEWAAQELVDRFVAAGAVKVFVGPRLHLEGPRNVVIKLRHHDDHMHVRLPKR